MRWRLRGGMGLCRGVGVEVFGFGRRYLGDMCRAGHGSIKEHSEDFSSCPLVWILTSCTA